MRRVILFIALISLCQLALAQGTLKFNVQVTGLEEPLSTNAVARLNAIQKPVKDNLTPDIIQKLFQKGTKEIRLAIQPFGYFKPSITKKLTSKNNVWTAYYYVNPGPPLHITTLHINIIGPGAHNQQLQQLLQKLRRKTGKIFSTKLYNNITNRLLEKAQENGYLRATFSKNQIIINQHQYTCAITLVFDTGPRYYFGLVTFSPSPLANSFLHRYVEFDSKTPFSYTKLIDLKDRLSGSGYFSSVTSVTNHKNPKQKHIPVRINLKMNKNKAYKFGIGYGTVSGPRATIGFNWRWLNRTGDKLNLYTRVSATERNLVAQYIIPGKHPAKEQYAITGGIYKITPQQGESFMQSLGVSYIRHYARWQQTISLEGQNEHYRVLDGQPKYHAKMLVPTISISHLTTNKIIDTSRGNRFTFTIRGASEDILSNVSFIQAIVKDKFIYTIWQDNRIVLRGRLGYTAGKKTAQLPVSKQFYTGGIDSVRGFGYNYLGPGKYLAVGSAELQRRIYKKIYGAVFYDKGNAMNKWDNMNLVHSYGVGIVWQTQLGALQIYVARASDENNRKNKHHYRLEFSLGPDL
ncbi:MAG: BamA/TamA family outer membrane protein [Gammaproteobacteria bacterium]|jgi:translocation and assembly module TamA